MNKEDEALKLALDAAYLAGFKASDEGYKLEYGLSFPEGDGYWKKNRDDVVTRIKQAFAAKPQTPTQCGACGDMDAAHQAKCTVPTCWVRGEAVAEPVQPVAWLYHDAKSLEDLLEAERNCRFTNSVLLSIRRHKGYRNETPLYTTPPAEQPATVQEPVAWMYEDMMGIVGVRVQKERPIVARPVTPLYTTPPAAQPADIGIKGGAA
jgi:hypothetical protein